MFEQANDLAMSAGCRIEIHEACGLEHSCECPCHEAESFMHDGDDRRAFERVTPIERRFWDRREGKGNW